MRFDLAVNGMVLGAMKTGKIPVMRDGSQWRPFIHVSDIARAILMLLQKQPRETNRQIINVGSDDQNYQIKELAEIVAGSLSKKPEIEWYGSPDKRSYRVSFAKARKTLGYESKTTPGMAAKEIEDALLSGKVKDSTDTKTLDWYKHLLSDEEASREVELRGVVL
jgi:nucleoside-diphosphate-sugar epimerase